MIKPEIKALQTYESPKCETMDFISTVVLCASENGIIEDLGTNDWGEIE